MLACIQIHKDRAVRLEGGKEQGVTTDNSSTHLDLCAQLFVQAQASVLQPRIDLMHLHTQSNLVIMHPLSSFYVILQAQQGK